jgi:iron(II)-dependent oxidoreductase
MRTSYTLAALHEDMHAENLTLIRRTLGYPLPRLSLFDAAAVAPPVNTAYRRTTSRCPEARSCSGASPDEPFVFDNEKWAHPVTVAPFHIAATPVTNAEYAGLRRRRRLSAARAVGPPGWDWRRRENAQHPLFWIAAARLVRVPVRRRGAARALASGRAR